MNKLPNLRRANKQKSKTRWEGEGIQKWDLYFDVVISFDLDFRNRYFFEWKSLKRSTCFTVWPLHTNYFLTFFHFWNRTCSSVLFAFLIHCFSQHDNGLGKQLHQTKHLWCIRDGVVCRKFLLGFKLEIAERSKVKQSVQCCYRATKRN